MVPSSVNRAPELLDMSWCITFFSERSVYAAVLYCRVIVCFFKEWFSNVTVRCRTYDLEINRLDCWLGHYQVGWVTVQTGN